MRRDDICLYLNPLDRARPEEIVADHNSPRKWVWRADIVLATVDGRGTNAIMRRTGKSKPCVWRWQERYIDEGGAGPVARQDAAFAHCTACGREEEGHYREGSLPPNWSQSAARSAADVGARRRSVLGRVAGLGDYRHPLFLNVPAAACFTITFPTRPNFIALAYRHPIRDHGRLDRSALI
jgi:hypothetical protein